MHTRLSWRATVALSGLAALASLSVLGPGCGVLNEIMGPTGPTQATQADVDAAVAAKELAKLEQICWGKTTNLPDVMRPACKHGVALLKEQGNYDRLKAICSQTDNPEWRGDAKDDACDAVREQNVASLLKASCDELPATFEANSSVLNSDVKLFTKMGVRFAECGRWNYIIEKLMHLGESGGPGEVMTRAVLEKYPQFENKVLAWMKAHMDNPHSFKFARRAFDHYMGALIQLHRTKKCRAYYAYADKLPGRFFGSFNWYFRKAKCKGAEKLAVKRLASDRASTRQGACKTVALLGSKRKYLKKLKLLAKHDPFFILHEDTIPPWKEYAVRDTCAKAANQLSLK